MRSVLWTMVVDALASVVMIVVALLDYTWWDKRTRRFKKARRVLFAVLGLLLLVSVAKVYQEGQTRQAEAAELRTALEGLRASEEAAATTHEKYARQIQALQAMLEPFLALARRRAPAADDAAALRSLASRLRRLEGETAEQFDSARRLAIRREYRDLSPEARRDILAGLRRIAPDLARHGLGVGINWFNDSGNTLGSSAEQLRKLLRESDVTVSAFAPVVEAVARRRQACLVCNQSNAELCGRFQDAIHAAVALPLCLNATWNVSQVGVMLAGTPTFSDSGSLTLE